MDVKIHLGLGFREFGQAVVLGSVGKNKLRARWEKAYRVTDRTIR